MSTRSLINVECNDGIIRSIYCHFDGMDHLETLNNYYNSQIRAEELVYLGDLSALGKYLSQAELDIGLFPEKHTFARPIKDVCIFYHRDRQDDWDDCKPEEFTSFEKAAKQRKGQQYIYEWDGTWHQIKV